MSKQRKLQERFYHFPYHFLPYIFESNVWKISRILHWGYEYLAILENVVKFIEDFKPRKILDFGCGDGRLIYEILLRGINVEKIVGVDISSQAILFAKAFVEPFIVDANVKINFTSSLEEIIEGREKFDLVTAIEVLEHIPPHQVNRLIREIHSIISNGIFIVSIPTTNVRLNPKHYRHFTLADLEREVGEFFLIREYLFVHRENLFYKFMQRILVNRFIVLNWPPLLKLTTRLYKQLIMYAKESDGAHIISILEKRENGEEKGGRRGKRCR
jgi:2-polyprenyl-3-methyl-5-hydroxy-6-metoxy-1,4-benzoquinol methylase